MLDLTLLCRRATHALRMRIAPTLLLRLPLLAPLLAPLLVRPLLLGLAGTPANAQTADAAADQLPVVVGRSPLLLPAPAGFAEASSVVPTMRTFGETLTPPTNRFLAMFLSPADVQRAAAGAAPEMQRYFMVQTLRGMESGTVASADFDAVRGVLRQQYAQLLKAATPAVQEHVDGLNRRLADADAHTGGAAAPQVKVGELVPLDVFYDRGNALSLLALTQVQVQQQVDGALQTRAVPLAMSITTTIVKGKVLYLYAYSHHRSAADLAWLKEQTLAWLPQLNAANPAVTTAAPPAAPPVAPSVAPPVEPPVAPSVASPAN